MSFVFNSENNHPKVNKNNEFDEAYFRFIYTYIYVFNKEEMLDLRRTGLI